MATYNTDLQDNNGNSYRVMANPDSKIDFSVSGSRENIAPGESIRTMFGKIKKWFTDLTTVAFTGSYNDLGNKPTIPSGAAANYPVANNDTTNNAGYLVTAQVAYQHGQEIDQLISDLTTRLPGGTGIQWDGTNFWGTTTGGVKKKLGKTVYDLGTGSSFNVSNTYEDFRTLTAQDFYPVIESFYAQGGAKGDGDTGWIYTDGTGILGKSYDPNTGILSISGLSISNSGQSTSGGNVKARVSVQAQITIRVFLII